MKIRTIDVVRTGILAGLAIAVQAMGLPQQVTGPAVNAVLFVTGMFVSPLAGAAVGILTPWIGLMTGKALAVAVPVIMAGNVSLALFSGYVQKLNKYAAMAGAAFVKWGVMSLGIKMLISGGKKLPAPAITSLTITQLYTALGGAVVAALVLAALDRSKK